MLPAAYTAYVTEGRGGGTERIGEWETAKHGNQQLPKVWNSGCEIVGSFVDIASGHKDGPDREVLVVEGVGMRGMLTARCKLEGESSSEHVQRGKWKYTQ